MRLFSAIIVSGVFFSAHPALSISENDTHIENRAENRTQETSVTVDGVKAAETSPAPEIPAPEIMEMTVRKPAKVAEESEQGADHKLITQSEPVSDFGNFFAPLSNIFSSNLTNDTAGTATEKPAKADAASETSKPDVAVALPEKTPRRVDPSLIVAAPWQLSPHTAVFAPEVDIFDAKRTGVPIPVAARVIKVEKTKPVKITTIEPAIRKATHIDPVVRNHRNLGKPTKQKNEAGLLDRLLSPFIGKRADTDDTTEQGEALTAAIPDRIIPEKTPEAVVNPEPQDGRAGPRDELTVIGEGIVKNIDLYLGAKTVIGRPFEPTTHPTGSCIKRDLQVSIFCIGTIDWPADIAPSFSQNTAFTSSGQGVIRYENGRISRVYTPFKAGNFADVVKFMQRRFGPPLEREVIWMHMIEAPEMPNTTFRWRAVTAGRKNSVVLEVRNYDDLRRSFADLDSGMVRLYRDGSRPIFKHLSTMDLMMMHHRRVSQGSVRQTTNGNIN